MIATIKNIDTRAFRWVFSSPFRKLFYLLIVNMDLRVIWYLSVRCFRYVIHTRNLFSQVRNYG